MLDTFKTTYTGRSTPNKGETWFARLPDAKALTTVVVTDITAHTVEVKTLGEQRFRYVTEDVTFVEKVDQ
jgi:hypothetical protein